MTLAHLVPLAISFSMGLIVFGLGLTARFSVALALLERPGLLLRSLISMNVIMTVVAAAAVVIFDLPQQVKITLLALALSPVPPILPAKQRKAGGSNDYILGLLLTASLLSIVIVPSGIRLLELYFGGTATVPFSRLASVAFISIVIPLLAGMAVRRLAPAFAAKAAHPIGVAAVVLLVLSFLPVLVHVWPTLMAFVGNGTLMALAMFTLIGVAVGHALGGPIEDERTVLALATSTRHPGVALAITGSLFPNEKGIIAVVLWHLIVGAIVCVPYVMWRRRRHGHA